MSGYNETEREKEFESRVYCSVCQADLTFDGVLQCDECNEIVCIGVECSSCWHQHLQDTHGIDWSHVHIEKESGALPLEFVEEQGESIRRCKHCQIKLNHGKF